MDAPEGGANAEDGGEEHAESQPVAVPQQAGAQEGAEQTEEQEGAEEAVEQERADELEETEETEEVGDTEGSDQSSSTSVDDLVAEDEMAEQARRVRQEMERRAGLTVRWTCVCTHVNDESIAKHWCEVCGAARPADAKGDVSGSQEEYAAAQNKRKQALERQRELARLEAERLAEERELQKEFELTGTNRRIEAQKKKERDEREGRERKIRGFIEAGSKLLIQIGRTGDAGEQRALAERAAMAFQEVLIIEPNDPKGTFGLEQCIATVDALDRAEDAVARAEEEAAERAKAAEKERLRKEKERKEQAGFNLARRFASRTMAKQVRTRRRVLITGAASTLGTSLRRHWAHGSVMDVDLWNRISADGTEAWRPYDAPYELLLTDERAIPPEQLGSHEVFRQLDAADYAGLRRACEGIDTVVHLGGVAQEEQLATMHDPDSFYLSMLRPCILQAFNVFHAATEAGCRRVVYASSAHAVAGNVYGKMATRQGVVTNDDVPTYRQVRKMTVGDVCRWLYTVEHPEGNMGEYEPAFRKNQVDGAVLCRFRIQEDGGLNLMKHDLGISHLGHRNRILDALEAMWRGEPKENDLADWRQGRLNLPPDHQSVPQSIYGATHCWGESLARVYSRIGAIASRRPTPEQAFATGLGHPWEPAGTKTYVDPAGTVHITEQKEEKDMAKTAELDMGWLITGEAADTHTAALERSAACVTGMWAPTPHVSRRSRIAVGGGVEIDKPLSCVAIRLGYRGFKQHDPWNAEHPSFGISELDCAQLFAKVIDVAKLIDPDSERNAEEVFFAVAHGISRHNLSWLDLDSTCKMFGYKPVDGTACPRHEPPELVEQSTSDEEDETKSLATHVALRPTVVREEVGTKSRRTGKLNAGDFLQVHEEQMGQKGVNRLKITVVPEVMPEEEYDALGHLIDPLKNAIAGWVSANAPNGTELVVTLERSAELKAEQAKAAQENAKPWENPQYSNSAEHHVNAQRLRAAADAGRVAPRETLPEEAHLSSLVNGLETPDARFSRLAAEKAEADRIEAERKAALAAAAAQSQAAKDRAAAAAAAEAERLRRLAEEEERNKPKRRVAGFDLIMKEQSGSHAYDHDNATLVEQKTEADMAREEYDRMKEQDERKRAGFIVAEQGSESQQ